MKKLDIGDIGKFKIKDISGRVFDCEGIVNGRVKDHGGFKYIITAWKIINPPDIGIRNVE